MIFKNKKILTNWDDEPFYNTETGEFLMEFTEAQKELLLYALYHKLPVKVFAYSYIPAEYMKTIIVFYENTKKVSDKDVWEICHTNLSHIGLDSCLVALANGIKMVKEISSIDVVSEMTLYWVSVAAMNKKNLCSMVHKYPTEDIRKKAEKSKHWWNRI